MCIDNDTAADDVSSKEDIIYNAGLLGSTICLALVIVSTIDKLVFSVVEETMDHVSIEDDEKSTDWDTEDIADELESVVLLERIAVTDKLLVSVLKMTADTDATEVDDFTRSDTEATPGELPSPV